MAPFLISALSANALTAFCVSLVFGVVFFTCVFSWIFDVPGYHFLHHVLLGLYFGPLMGLFGWVINRISRRWNAAAALSASPFIWVSIEYIRSNLSFLALPWALLGHSQYQYPVIIQFASYTGAYGTSFLVAFANAAVAATILAYYPVLAGDPPTRISAPSRQAAICMSLTAVVLIGAALTYGYVIVSQPIAGPAIKTAVLQGNINQEMKANPNRYSKFIMGKYTDLTRKALKDQPELLVWPEAATPGFVLKNLSLYQQITSLVQEADIYFLIGSSEYPKFAKPSSPRPKDIGNTALFFSPAGKVVGQYLKIHLVPFGEYIPYSGVIPWPGFIVPEGKNNYEIPGKEFTLFRIGHANFGVLICWEIVFPELFRTFVKKGANFMINVTNEGWFGKTAAPYQMVAVNVFRAVENRIAVGRAANTGISCFIDPHGRVTGRVKNNNEDIFVEGYLTQKIPLSHQKTFYTRYGDIFVYAILALTVFLIAAMCFGRKK